MPRTHLHAITKRGLLTHELPYYCFVTPHDNEQEEAGDTLIHTFLKPNWYYCETRWFSFVGSVAGVQARSDTAYFEKHSTILHTTTFDATGKSGLVYANKNTYAEARDALIGVVVENSNLGTAGQAKEGLEGFYIWRAGLFFNTASLPDYAVVVSAKLIFKVQFGGKFSAIYDDDQHLIVLPGDVFVDNEIAPAHYWYLKDVTLQLGSTDKYTWTAGGHASLTEIDLNMDLVTIDKEGITKFALRGSHDINNIPDVLFTERNRYDYQVPRLAQTGWCWLELKWR
ncbi:hypothetical protein ES703_120468 [subsurface metagenome]